MEEGGRTGSLGDVALDSPAVNDYRSCILGVTHLHLLQELQHPDRGEGDPKVRPTGEVELGHQALRLFVCDITYLWGEHMPWILSDTQLHYLPPGTESREELPVQGSGSPKVQRGWNWFWDSELVLKA